MESIQSAFADFRSAGWFPHGSGSISVRSAYDNENGRFTEIIPYPGMLTADAVLFEIFRVLKRQFETLVPDNYKPDASTLIYVPLWIDGLKAIAPLGASETYPIWRVIASYRLSGPQMTIRCLA